MDNWQRMSNKELIIRSYNEVSDRVQVEDLERRCEVGPSNRVFLFSDTLGDPICRIRNSPIYTMLVAQLEKELVGIIQGSIKVVTLHNPPNHRAKVGYILGLRVAPLHRRTGIGSTLMHHLEQWFIANDVDYSYMATEKDNYASFNLFVNKLNYMKFRTPTILVNPVQYRPYNISSNIEISRLKVEEAESLYRNYMSTMEFFPHDIDHILKNKLSLGTWVAYFKEGSKSKGHHDFASIGQVENSWAMVSVWNSGNIFKLRLGKSPFSYLTYTKFSKLLKKLFIFPCFKLPLIPNLFYPFGFYFMYGMYQEGPLSEKLVTALCQYVNNMATKCSAKDCKIIVAEVGGEDKMVNHIPHWKLMSCPEDLWCIKTLKNKERCIFHDLAKSSSSRALFVDPREV